MAATEKLKATAAREPYVNYCLIAINLMVFAWELALGSNLPKATEILGFIPARFLNGFGR